MSNSPDGKSAKTQRVVFTRPAADRISKVVRLVEAGQRDAGPLTFGRPQGASTQAIAFRIATFTGSWSKGQVKTVTLAYQTNTPNTYVATNLFANISVDCGTRKCAIAREGTAWFLIQAEC